MRHASYASRTEELIFGEYIMKSRNGLLLALALLCAGLFGSTTQAVADSQEITIKSNADYKVHLKFFSQNYSRSWPGPNASTVWVLDDYEVKTVNLSCVSGERICYGAWVAGDSSQYWGVGSSGRAGCSSCCITCGGGTARTWVLEEDADGD